MSWQLITLEPRATHPLNEQQQRPNDDIAIRIHYFNDTKSARELHTTNKKIRRKKGVTYW